MKVFMGLTTRQVDYVYNSTCKKKLDEIPLHPRLMKQSVILNLIKALKVEWDELTKQEYAELADNNMHQDFPEDYDSDEDQNSNLKPAKAYEKAIRSGPKPAQRVKQNNVSTTDKKKESTDVSPNRQEVTIGSPKKSDSKENSDVFAENCFFKLTPKKIQFVKTTSPLSILDATNEMIGDKEKTQNQIHDDNFEKVQLCDEVLKVRNKRKSGSPIDDEPPAKQF